MHDARSKWSNPVMWLLVGLPAAAVIGGIGLVVVANRDPADVSIDRVQRTAQIQVADLGPDAAAQQGKLSAVVRIAADAVEVIPVRGTFDRKAPLRLTFIHPTASADDVALALIPGANGWRAAGSVATTHDWKVQLEPADRHWRIVGQLPKAQKAVLLQPALSQASPPAPTAPR